MRAFALCLVYTGGMTFWKRAEADTEAVLDDLKVRVQRLERELEHVSLDVADRIDAELVKLYDAIKRAGKKVAEPAKPAAPSARARRRPSAK